MLAVGCILVLASFVGLMFLIDPSEMDRRHNSYAAGYRHGYRGLPLAWESSQCSRYPHAFRAGWRDGVARRQFDTIGK